VTGLPQVAAEFMKRAKPMRTANVYYNEFEPYAAEWLRNLMAAGHLPAGEVDERDINEVAADDLKEFDQCHFFSGLGGWPYALELAGWGSRPVWTGSCPCQPFSNAGKHLGADDPRHLWPSWIRLIRECRPDVIFGEQVEGAIGKGWLDRVFADLEAEDYTCGAAVLGAHSVGAPHRRQRLWWVADAASPRQTGTENPGADREDEGQGPRGEQLERSGADNPLADTSNPDRRTREWREEEGTGPHGERRRGLGECRRVGNAQRDRRGEQEHARQQGPSGDVTWGSGEGRQRDGEVGLGNPDSAGLGQQRRAVAVGEEQQPSERGSGDSFWVGDTSLPEEERQPVQQEQLPRPSNFWDRSDLIPCGDGKARRVEPGVAPLAHGVSNRVGRLRAYGNAICPQVAAEFIEAVMDK
jgi:DNA (cytosine-5)-methyltransferase 1